MSLNSNIIIDDDSESLRNTCLYICRPMSTCCAYVADAITNLCLITNR